MYKSNFPKSEVALLNLRQKEIFKRMQELSDSLKVEKREFTSVEKQEWFELTKESSEIEDFLNKPAATVQLSVTGGGTAANFNHQKH